MKEFYTVYVKPWKFLGSIPMSKEKYVYQACQKYSPSYFK